MADEKSRGDKNSNDIQNKVNELFETGLHEYDVANYNSARTWFQKALNCNSDSIKSWAFLGKALTALETNEKENLICYSNALNYPPQDTQDFIGRGIALDYFRLYDRALESFETALNLDPTNVSGWKYKGHTLLSLKRYDDALKCYDKALELNPHNIHVFHSKTSVLRALKKDEDALRVIETSLENNSSDIDGLSLKAEILIDLDRTEEALVYFDKALQLDPTSNRVLSLKASCLYGFNKKSEALDIFLQIIKSEQKGTPTFAAKVIAFIYLKKPEDALECINSAIRIDPYNPELWNLKGACLCDELKRYDEAIECYDRALHMDPKNPDILINKGSCLEIINRLDEAIECYDRALQIDPKNIDAWNSKGYSLFLQKKYEKAIECFDHLLDRLDKNNKTALMNKGVVLDCLRRHKDANESYDKVITFAPLDSKPWMNKGDPSLLTRKNIIIAVFFSIFCVFINSYVIYSYQVEVILGNSPSFFNVLIALLSFNNIFFNVVDFIVFVAFFITIYLISYYQRLQYIRDVNNQLFLFFYWTALIGFPLYFSLKFEKYIITFPDNNLNFIIYSIFLTTFFLYIIYQLFDKIPASILTSKMNYELKYTYFYPLFYISKIIALSCVSFWVVLIIFSSSFENPWMLPVIIATLIMGYLAIYAIQLFSTHELNKMVLISPKDKKNPKES